MSPKHQTGQYYFTESTADYHFEHYTAPIVEARGTGGLYRLDADGSITTLVDGLYFANGLTTTADSSALVFAETQARRLSKYWLRGPRAGSVTPLAAHLPGMPDNLSTGADGRIWAALVAEANPALEALFPRAPMLRKVVWRLPERLQPTIKQEIWAVAFDPDSGAAVAGLRTHHADFGAVTGLVESAGKLWLGTINFPAIARVDLAATAL